MQLDLFMTSEAQLLRHEVATLKAELGNLRRGLFARHTELAKLYLELREGIDALNAQMPRKAQQIDLLELVRES